MKTLAFCLTTIMLASGAVSAGDGKSADAKFSAMDTNGDGMLSAAEHSAGAAAMFRDADADRDGSMTAAEMDAAHKATKDGKPTKGDSHRQDSAEKIRLVDADGNGQVSQAEHEAGAQAMFTRLDTDGNGSVSMQEMQAGHRAMTGAHAGKSHGAHDQQGDGSEMPSVDERKSKDER